MILATIGELTLCSTSPAFCDVPVIQLLLRVYHDYYEGDFILQEVFL